MSWPGVIDAGRDMTNDGTVQLLLSPERQPTFAIHKHCLWVLCRDGSVSYMDAYRLCRSLQQEKGDEPGFDSIIDPLHLFGTSPTSGPRQKRKTRLMRPRRFP